MSNEKFYLIAKEDKTWAPLVSESLPDENAVEFVTEEDYPVQLFFERTDVNGSSVVEMEVCSDRYEVMEVLSYIGECRFLPLNLWEFNAEEEMSTELFQLLSSAVYARAEMVRKSLDDEILAAKLECVNTLLDQDHDVIIVDPDSEYIPKGSETSGSKSPRTIVDFARD